MDYFLKRNRVAFASAGKGSRKGVISKFEVSPIKNQGRLQSTFIMDSDITKILETSYKTLTYCNLVYCSMLTSKSFKSISQAKCLQWLSISNSQRLDDESACLIVRECNQLLHLNISRCRELTDTTMECIADNLTRLESLDVSENTKMVVDFRGVAKLKTLTKLHELDLCTIGMTDSKLLSIVKNTPTLEVLNLEACNSITAEGLRELLTNRENLLRRIILCRTNIEREGQQVLKQLETTRPDLELVYHHENNN